MISAQAARSWRVFHAVGIYLPLTGGALMLLGAGAIRDSNSVPLLLIGCGWIAIGLGGLWLRPRVAREVTIDGVAPISHRESRHDQGRGEAARLGRGPL